MKQLLLDLVFIFLEDPLLSSIFPATLLAAALSAFDGIFSDVQLVFFVTTGRVVLHHTSESPAAAASPNLQQGSKRKQKLVKVNSIARINNDLKQREEGARSANSITFSDLESTRIDFEDPNHTQTVIESDNNSDIVIDEKKIVPESSKFKIVFISSESKSGSELNSSLECAESPESGQNSSEDQLKNVKGDYIEEGDWLNYQKKTGKAGKMNNSSSSPAVGGKHKARKLPQNLATARDSPRNSGGEDFSYVNNFLGDLKNRPPQSPSIRTIMTTATKDSNSIPASPQVPKIHNILIRREMELGQRPRSAMSMMSETSVDFEVQNILGSKQSSRGPTSGSANESQEIMIDFDSTIDSTGGNTSFELCTPTPLGQMASQQSSGVGVKPAHGNFHGKGYLAASAGHRADSTRSSADRSLDEMSLYDQMCTQKIRRAAKKDPRVEEYRNLVLAEIKSLTGPGLMSRSLSESDLSELGGATVSGQEAPSDDETENSTPRPTTLVQVHQKEDYQVLHQKEDSTSTASSGYTTSSSGKLRRSSPVACLVDEVT